MRMLLALATACSLVAVAACNRGDDGAAVSSNQADVAGNGISATAPGSNSVEPARTPEQIAALMHERHENFEEMGDAMKGIGRELKAGAPAVARVQRPATTIAGFGQELLTWFPAGSGPETGRDTRAKAEIWQDMATFRQRGEAFQAESARFNQIAQAGDVAAIRAAMPDLGNSCKNCHDRFRAPED
jgi:cytochrome c556